MSNKKDKKQDKPTYFYWIFNSEENVVGMSYAKTADGALARFETVSGLDREGYRAERTSFGDYNCTVLPFNIG